LEKIAARVDDDAIMGLLTAPNGARAQFLSRHPPAAFEVAGAGNGVTVGSTRARMGKPWIQTRS